MKIAYVAAMAVGLSLLVAGCGEDSIPENPDKNGVSIVYGGADKSKPWLTMNCKPQADGTFTYTVEGDHLIDASVQLGARVLQISPDGKLLSSSLSGVKKEVQVTYSYRLADGASRRVDLKGCTQQ